MNYSLLNFTKTQKNLTSEHLNVLSVYQSPEASRKKLLASYAIDTYLSFIIASQLFAVYETFLSSFVHQQLIWESQNYFSADSTMVVMCITPIIFWTIQFIGTFVAQQTPGMKLMKIFVATKKINPFRLNFSESFIIASLYLFSSWSLGLVMFIKKNNTMLVEHMTDLRFLNKNEFDWAQEIATAHQAPSYEEFPFKLVDEIESIHDKKEAA